MAEKLKYPFALEHFCTGLDHLQRILQNIVLWLEVRWL